MRAWVRSVASLATIVLLMFALSPHMAMAHSLQDTVAASSGTNCSHQPCHDWRQSCCGATQCMLGLEAQRESQFWPNVSARPKSLVLDASPLNLMRRLDRPPKDE